MTKIINFALKIKGSGREGDTCEVLRPCHPPKIWNVHLEKLCIFLNFSFQSSCINSKKIQAFKAI